MTDLREVFSKYRVYFRESGRNVSAGNIVLNCCFCSKTSNPDPGEHLALHLETGTYFCYRNSKHKGYVSRILRYLNIPQQEWEHVSNKKYEREVVVEQKDFSLFQHFKSADQSPECMAYLQERGFSRPIEIIGRFNLRFDLHGRWAGRLIIPLTAGWTGRSLREHISPKYLTESTSDGFFLVRNNSTSCILVEGPVDALRIASVTNQFDVIAKTTNRIKPSIFSYLRDNNYLSIWSVPDSDVPFDLDFSERQLLKSYCTSATVAKLTLPGKKKDFGEMDELETREFLIGSQNAVLTASTEVQ